MTDKDRIYELAEKITKNISLEEEAELKELLKPYQNGSIGLVQINPIVGDIEYNSKKVVKYIKLAQNIGLDLVIFPQLTLTGFPLEDTISRYPIVVEENIKWLNETAKITTKTTAVVGFVEQLKDGSMNNSVAILQGGKIKNIVQKSSLFIPENYCGKKYGIMLGETFAADTILNENPDVLINVNQVGAVDNKLFAGSSKVFYKNGKLLACAKSFEEQFLIVNPNFDLGKIYPSFNSYKNNTDTFTLDYEPDLERVYKALILGIKDYFGKTGFKRAVLGLSGGLDSTVCAVLLADALGAENVFGISMPSKITSDESKNDAAVLAQNLGINFAQAPIREMFETTNNCLQNLFKEVETKWEGRFKQSFTSDNIQARSRAMFLWGISNEFSNCLPIATSDKSEAYMGYATINGDMSGGFAPIADITKTKLFALARWLNKNRYIKNAIPENIIHKKPGAELAIDSKTGKPLIAEDALMPYEFLDEVIWRIENKKQQYSDMIDSEFCYEKHNTITKEQKIEWLDKFYRRMAAALFKKSILPPSIIIDSPSEHKQPISSKINYKGVSVDEIRKIISQI